jgi:hypothetical protein
LTSTPSWGEEKFMNTIDTKEMHDILTFRDPVKSIARAALARARYVLDKSEKPDAFLARAYPFDSEAQLLLRAATSPIDLNTGAALISIAAAVGPLLFSHSAAAKLFAEGVQVTLGRDPGMFTVPAMSTAPVRWVGDGKMKPVVQSTSEGARVEPKKIAGIAVASAELMAQQSAPELIQAMLAESAGPVLDAAVFTDSPGVPGEQPAGLLYGVAPLAAGAGMMADIGALAGAISPIAGAGKVAIVANWAQLIPLALSSSGSSPDLLLLASGAVPPGTVIAIACNAVVSAMGVPSFETATQATLMMDDAPASGDLLGGGNVSSMFQTNCAAIKMVLESDWATRSPLAAAWIQGVAW